MSARRRRVRTRSHPRDLTHRSQMDAFAVNCLGRLTRNNSTTWRGSNRALPRVGGRRSTAESVASPRRRLAKRGLSWAQLLSRPKISPQPASFQQHYRPLPSLADPHPVPKHAAEVYFAWVTSEPLHRRAGRLLSVGGRTDPDRHDLVCDACFAFGARRSISSS